MERDKFITWVLLGAILWEVSKMASPSSLSQYGAIAGGDNGPCGTLFPDQRQWSPQTPYWIQLMQQNNPGSQFTYEAE
jgi:hypothetical protein